MKFFCGLFLIFLFGAHAENLSFMREVLLNCRYLSRKQETCYYTRIPGDLPAFELNVKYLKDDFLFFIETSCRGDLDPRQMCAVEAAARSNPDREIVILFVGPVAKLIKFPYKNIHLYRLNATLLPQEIYPLMSMVRPQIRCIIVRLPEILRFMIFYKYGGIFLDWNVMLVKSLDYLSELKNFAGKIDYNLVGAGVLGLSTKGVGKMISDHVLRIYKQNYMTNRWRQNATAILTRVLKKICSPAKVKQMTAEVCGNFEVYDPNVFYPVHYRSWKYYYVYSYEKVPPDPYAFYVWYSSTYNETVFRESMYGRLITSSCPANTELGQILDDMFLTTEEMGVKRLPVGRKGGDDDDDDDDDDPMNFRNAAVVFE